MVASLSQLLAREEILSFFFIPSFLRLSFEDGNIDLGSVLLTLVLSSILGVVLPNFLNEDPRTHNALKLFNDCLGRVQLAFVSFYLTLLVVNEFKTFGQRRLMGSFLLASGIFFVIGVRLTRGQDRKVERLHGKSCYPGGEDCDLPLGSKAWKIYGQNVILAIISSVFAVYIAFSPNVVTPKTASDSTIQSSSRAIQPRAQLR